MSHRLHRVRIETARHRIEGTVQLPEAGFRSRITDFLKAHGRDYIAVTDARLTPVDGGVAEDPEFLTVSAHHIELVTDLGSAEATTKPS